MSGTGGKMDVQQTAEEVRQQLVRALRLDLVGPHHDGPLSEERLDGDTRPSSFYLTGFLVPTETPVQERGDEDADEELVEEGTADPEEGETEEKAHVRRGFFPSSIGLSFLVPPHARALEVHIRWGDYTRERMELPDGKHEVVWQRAPREARHDLILRDEVESRPMAVADSGGLEITSVVRTIGPGELGNRLPIGARSVSVFLVNRRPIDEEFWDSSFAFQAEIEVRCDEGFAPRPDPSMGMAPDQDERVADLHYADTPEYATGHGTSSRHEMGANGRCCVLRTDWIPEALVEKTETAAISGVELSMDALSKLRDGAEVVAALSPLVEQYRAWITAQVLSPSTVIDRQATASGLKGLARSAADRMERGIQVLATDADALDAFRMANRAVAEAMRKKGSRGGVDQPSWRAFQLGFILLNLPGMADPTAKDREVVDLLFFPTGGGKTEAYLGLAAFTMVLRRLRNPANGGRAGCGVSVIMRYTLRLLTLDQLVRATGLICALELLRRAAPERYGEWPFEIGLWVGKGATPNKMGMKGGKTDRQSARSRVNDYQSDPGKYPPPIPIESCPWCETKLVPNSYNLMPNADSPQEMKVVCVNSQCEFSGDFGLPIVAVDESIYRRLPGFLISTVDKFASLPWVAHSGALLGGSERYNDLGFYGAADGQQGKPLAAPLLPPDLIIQDELHLISGPLGTMVGLYESVIEALAQRFVDGKVIKPKIVASTATVRGAVEQNQALFARGATHVFPPAGLNRRDSFFAQTRTAAEAPARLYVGVAAQGRNQKVVMRRIWLALLAAAEKAYQDAGGAKNPTNPADPYMTVLGYFNALRDLGGARRVLEEQVQNTVKVYGSRLRVGERSGLFKNRKRFAEIVELTSRVTTDKVAEARERLGAPHGSDRSVDCALATNMISVGLDIPRLGLMAVAGQPKTHAEYIQATSRVGRSDRGPGLVVTQFHMLRPRDRSHYERFIHYHETFYRSVESGSVTPFSARALDRGFGGALVGFVRHCDPEMTSPAGVKNLRTKRPEIERRLLSIMEARVRSVPFDSEPEREERLRSVRNRVLDLLDSWETILEDYRREGTQMQYQRYEKASLKPLLHEMLERDIPSENERKFRANRSLRDVEPSVNLFVKDLADGSKDRGRGKSLDLGEIRRGQIITTYGPGALIDLPTHSAIVGGLESWIFDGPREEVVEARLALKVSAITGVPHVHFYAPPIDSGGYGDRKSGIDAYRFPRWFVAQDATKVDGQRQERRLVSMKQLDDKGRLEGRPVVATRFVRTCIRGHIDDLDWYAYVHEGPSDCFRPLWLNEHGTSGDLSDLMIRCECGKVRSLRDASERSHHPLGACTGRRPWLGDRSGESCSEPSVLLIRTASDAYFSQVVTVLSLPDRGRQVDEVVEELWGPLKTVDALEELRWAKKTPHVNERLSPYADDLVFESILRRKSGKTNDAPIKKVELEAIAAAEIGFGDDVPVDPNFHARRLPDNVWRRSNQTVGIEAVIQLHRLKEVRALTGFTRLEPISPDIQGEFSGPSIAAVLAREPNWFPAVENRGEGIFLLLDPSAVMAWQERPEVRRRLEVLSKAQEAGAGSRSRTHTFPGGAYVLLHTLAHMLIQSVSTRCGYPASSLKERIYSNVEDNAYGLLLYTGSPDAEGTLGGLVQQARSIEDHLASALRKGGLCSNDPICAYHDPGRGMEGRFLHGAACHACTFISETSCEVRNTWLDRALVVPVLGLPGVAFFEDHG